MKNKTFHKKKILVVFLAAFILILYLIGRLVYLMVFDAEYYQQKAEDLHERERDIKAARGEIIDRNGTVLATNRTVCTISVIHSQIENPEKVIEKLSEFLEMDADQVRKKVEKISSIERIRSNVDKRTGDKIRNLGLAGVKVDEDFKRYYPYNELASKVLGFTGGDNQGIVGLEVKYEKYLKGINGKILTTTDARGIELDGIGENREEPQKGYTLRISLDADIQKYVQQAAQKVMEEKQAERVSILLINPQNGEILGMTSSYPYNLNKPMDEKSLLSLYSQSEIDKMKAYTKQKQAEETTDSEDASEDSKDSTKKKTDDQKTIYDAFNELWRNSIISDTNEPGSTYKPFTVATGLESGALTGNENYFCTGSLMVGKRNIGCSHVHGNITLKDAVAKSCNVAMMNIGFKEGADTFYKYQNIFGFGRSTGIDLPGETDTKSLVYNASNYSNSVTLATNAFGQNFNCTMMQMAAGFCSLINGGNYYRPHIVKQIQSDNGAVVKDIGKEVLRKTISEETSATIGSYMQQTVESGTGTKAQIEGYSIGGKTGTAEKIPRNKKDYYISFIGFTPVESPQLLIYVTIDEPNVSFQANAGLAVELEKACMEEIVDVLGIKPETTDTSNTDNASTEQKDDTTSATTEASSNTTKNKNNKSSSTTKSKKNTKDAAISNSEFRACLKNHDGMLVIRPEFLRILLLKHFAG